VLTHDRAPCRDALSAIPGVPPGPGVNFANLVRNSSRQVGERLSSASTFLPFVHPEDPGTTPVALASRLTVMELAEALTHLSLQLQEVIPTSQQKTFEDGFNLGVGETFEMHQSVKHRLDEGVAEQHYNRGYAAALARTPIKPSGSSAATCAAELKAVRARLATVEALYDSATQEYERVLRFADLDRTRAGLTPDKVAAELLLFPTLARWWSERTSTLQSREDMRDMVRLCAAAGHPRVPPSLQPPGSATIPLLSPWGVREGILPSLPARPTPRLPVVEEESDDDDV